MNSRLRKLCTLGLVVIAGAIINVTVAWGCAYWVAPSSDAKAFEHHFYFPRANPQWMVTAWNMPGALQIWTEAIQFEPEILARLHDLDFARPANLPPSWSRAASSAINDVGTERSLALEAARGWPAISMLATYTFFHGTEGWTKRGVRAGIDLSSADNDPSNCLFWRALPLKPLWPGFAINTLFYAVIVWLLLIAPFALRHRIRINRGLCPKCAYPIGASNVCTDAARHSLLPQPYAKINGPSPAEGEGIRAPARYEHNTLTRNRGSDILA